MGKAFKCFTEIKEKKKNTMSLAFSYNTDPNRVIKAADVFKFPYIVRGLKRAQEKKDYRERPDITRNIETPFASHRTFNIKRSIKGSITKEPRVMPARLRAARDLDAVNQLYAVKKRGAIQRFKEIKRPSNAVTATRTNEATSLLYTMKEKDNYKTSKMLIGSPDSMRANQIVATKGKEGTKRSNKLIRRPNIRRAIMAPDIRGALKALLEASSLLSAVGGKKTVGTSREAGGAKDQRYR